MRAEGTHTMEKVTMEQIKKYMQSKSEEDIAETCLSITDQLQDACSKVGELYQELEKKYPEIFAAIGFSVIATCNALPITSDHTPVCIVMGSAAGIQHAAQPLIEAFGKISREVRHDRKTRG